MIFLMWRTALWLDCSWHHIYYNKDWIWQFAVRLQIDGIDDASISLSTITNNVELKECEDKCY